MPHRSTLQPIKPRPMVSRQRSNSLPCFSLVNVSAQEASVLISAANRASARRRRPVSVDSPGPATYRSYNPEDIPRRNFHFSTPSRHGFGTSSLRHAVRPSTSSQSATNSCGTSEDSEITPVADDKPLPPVPEAGTRQRPVTATSSPPVSNLPSTPPFSPRRQVANPTLKAYADSLFSFTQNRLHTAAPQKLKVLGLSHEINLMESPPPTPELENDDDGEDDDEEIYEPTHQRPMLQSHFSDWSGATDSDADDAFLSSRPSSQPRTPEEETGMLSPDSFFNVDVTPRVAQRTQWTALSSARPSSNIAAVSPLDSLTHPVNSTSSSERDSFSYFAGFDSVTSAAQSRFSQTISPLEALQVTHSQAPNSNTNPPTSRNQPSRSNSKPCTPMNEMSQPPSWLLRTIC